ncbi:hypothetical protein HPB50_004868 [Hyalomma asiaticum]|uniref:Uncharacterized protein n=1 Tax=Hyalomma asiaticum TaxID=266040 RepID=A0ACB7SCQ6_HYAAI|nr:hypothetical protein HPB50_004868 [Hyalomma asiaticum]
MTRQYYDATRVILTPWNGHELFAVQKRIYVAKLVRILYGYQRSVSCSLIDDHSGMSIQNNTSFQHLLTNDDIPLSSPSVVTASHGHAKEHHDCTVHDAATSTLTEQESHAPRWIMHRGTSGKTLSVQPANLDNPTGKPSVEISPAASRLR